MGRQKSRSRIDSPQRQAQLMAAVKKGIAPPYGCEFANEEEAQIWALFIKARAPDDWREFDLISLFKIVQMEAMIREQTRILRTEGFVIEGARGLISNPRARVVQSQQRIQSLLINALNINIQAAQQNTVAAQARKANELAETPGGFIPNADLLGSLPHATAH